MSVRQFKEQMNYLFSNGYTVLPMSDLITSIANKHKLPSNSIVITFDDGYVSTYKFAYPILKNYEFPATIFVTVDRNSKVFKDVEGIDVPLSNHQIKLLAKNGIDIQSHTMTHPILTDLQPNEIELQLRDSKEILENLTGKEVSLLAIPGNFYNKKVKEIAKKVGYKGILTAQKGTVSYKSDVYSLRRLIVEGDFNIEDFINNLKVFRLCQIRMLSFFKELAPKILGPQNWLKIKRKLFHSPLGKFLVFRHLRIFLLLLLLTFFICLIYFWINK